MIYIKCEMCKKILSIMLHITSFGSGDPCLEHFSVFSALTYTLSQEKL